MTKKQEQAAEAATTPEITGETEAKTERKTPCVYCGPSVRGVARQYTVYASGNTPAALDEFVKQHPAAKNLLVPVERFAQTRKALETARHGGKHFVQQDQKRTVRRNNRYGYIQTWRIIPAN